MDTILLWIFIAIFVATAIITLGSLPGWIKIPDSYRKVLFSALLLEVASCILLLFGKYFLEDKAPNSVHIDGVGLTSEGELIHLSSWNENLLSLKPEDFADKLLNSATYSLVKEADKNDSKRIEFVVRNKSLPIGKVSLSSLDSLSLFDGIDPYRNEFKRVKYLIKDKRWEEGMKLSSGWPFDIIVNNSGYKISDKVPDYFPEITSSEFNSNARNLHFFRASDKAYYIVRISDANLGEQSPFVAFFVIRLVPTLTGMSF